jgi:hypothetical protein
MNKFSETPHSFGMAYLAYKKPYEAELVYPDQVLYSGGNEPAYAARFFDSWHDFIDMTRIEEKDLIPRNSVYIMDSVDPEQPKANA